MDIQFNKAAAAIDEIIAENENTAAKKANIENKEYVEIKADKDFNKTPDIDETVSGEETEIKDTAGADDVEYAEAEVVDKSPVDQAAIEQPVTKQSAVEQPDEKSEYENLVNQFNEIYKAVSNDKNGKGKGGKGGGNNNNTIIDVVNKAINGSNEMAAGKSGNVTKGRAMSASGGSGRGKGMGGGKGGGRGGKGNTSNKSVDLASTLIKGAGKGTGKKGGKSSGLGIALSLLSKGMKKR